MSEPLRVLVVDDERISRITTMQQLLDEHYISDIANNSYQALEKLEMGQWDVVVTDMRMPSMDGLELLRTIKKRFAEIDVILITAFGTVETAVAAMQEGAADYITKPFSIHELIFRLKKLQELRAAHKEVNRLRGVLNDAPNFFGLVGQAPPMKIVFEHIQAFADNTVPVLITGETGTGKELVTRALHSLGSRHKAPFIPLSCGSIPKELAESDLFGHEKGAFTNAIQRRLGNFERANGGTLLLDDVDDLPLEIQVKLLRVLQEGKVVRVGGTVEKAVDVRVVATTKLNLAQAVAAGRFRDDLFYRLRGLEIHLPPLRERGDDVLLLAQHFLHLLASRDQVEPKRLSMEAVRILRRYHWPGNVRELRRAMESANVICRESEIRLEHLPEFLRDTDGKEEPASDIFSLHLDRCDGVSFNDEVRRFEETLVQWALTKSGGQQSRAAALLSLPRTTFQSKSGHHKKS